MSTPVTPDRPDWTLGSVPVRQLRFVAMDISATPPYNSPQYDCSDAAMIALGITTPDLGESPQPISVLVTQYAGGAVVAGNVFQLSGSSTSGIVSVTKNILVPVSGTAFGLHFEGPPLAGQFSYSAAVSTSATPGIPLIVQDNETGPALGGLDNQSIPAGGSLKLWCTVCTHGFQVLAQGIASVTALYVGFPAQAPDSVSDGPWYEMLPGDGDSQILTVHAAFVMPTVSIVNNGTASGAVWVAVTDVV